MATTAAVPDAVVVEQVEVAFGSTVALDGIGLRVAPGGTLAVLGHDGAGKTSLIRVMTTAIRPDRGRVVIDGVDAIQRPAEVRRRIGVTGQYAGLDDFLTTRENLELVGRLAGLRGAARGRANDLVDRFELRDVTDRRVGELSGGTRRRVDLAAGLVGSPSVLFLDEQNAGGGDERPVRPHRRPGAPTRRRPVRRDDDHDALHVRLGRVRPLGDAARMDANDGHPQPGEPRHRGPTRQRARRRHRGRHGCGARRRGRGVGPRHAGAERAAVS